MSATVAFRAARTVLGVAAFVLLGACSNSARPVVVDLGVAVGSPGPSRAAHPRLSSAPASRLAVLPPSRPAVLPPSPTDVYAHARAEMFSPVVRDDPALVYVPNLDDATVSVISQATLQVARVLSVGAQPQHVVPSWDLRTLWVNDNAGDTLTAIDPRTGTVGRTVAVDDPYNLYFTPDGRSAMVMAEARHRVDFRDPHTFALQSSLDVGTGCAGVNHADFSADGSYAIVTCEFAGSLVKIDLRSRRITGRLELGTGSAPQDIKVAPDGKLWFVADMNRDGVVLLDGDAFRVVGLLPTGPEAHGLYPSRDGRYLYASNRGGQLTDRTPPYAHEGSNGSVSVVSFATGRVVAQWPIPGGGTPDMGNVSADGTRLWLSGRRSNEVYVFDTGGPDPTRGRLLARIQVGGQPHGLTVWPLPGRYSLGHTGILR